MKKKVKIDCGQTLAETAPFLSGNEGILLLLKVELLRKIALFRILPQPILEKVAEQTTEIVLKKDEILFEEGMLERSIYVILSGKIMIYRGSKKVVVLKQGEYLGEMSMVDSKPRSATAKALCDTLVMEISESIFFNNFSGDPKPLMTMMRTFSSRLRKDLDVMYSNVKSLSNLTHDMRNCLVPLGVAEVLLTDMLKNLGGTIEGHKKRKGWEEVRKCFDTMLSVKNNMVTLIDQSMATVLRTKSQYVKSSMDIVPLIEETIEEMSCHKWLKGKNLQVVMKEKVKKVEINYLDIKRVLQNLILNAGYVTEKGGNILVSVEDLEGCLQVSVKDNGCGIPDEIKPILLKENYTNKPEGHGFGLMSCKELIEDFHQGRIWFDSEAGKGANLHFTIPYFAAKTA
ncbi:MAG: cyclic nucleotide-binding domain-containing protein [Nitrospinae bacterium]|nr:cyclic nucleotide-binding domain-containing protein [Nitrospinota bacterium]